MLINLKSFLANTKLINEEKGVRNYVRSADDNRCSSFSS